MCFKRFGFSSPALSSSHLHFPPFAVFQYDQFERPGALEAMFVSLVLVWGLRFITQMKSDLMLQVATITGIGIYGEMELISLIRCRIRRCWIPEYEMVLLRPDRITWSFTSYN